MSKPSDIKCQTLGNILYSRQSERGHYVKHNHENQVICRGSTEGIVIVYNQGLFILNLKKEVIPLTKNDRGYELSLEYKNI